MTMHLARGLSTINTKKPKQKKLTKAQLEKLNVQWLQHNKQMRRNHMHDMQFEKFEDYVAYTRGQYKPKTKNTEFKPYTPPSYTRPDPTRNIPSVMEEMVKNGTWTGQMGGTPKKEPQKYTGTLIKGIATMHKSNAVPIINKEQAKDIANMRRS